MAYTWTEEMGAVGKRKELEAFTRAFVITACNYWDSLPTDETLGTAKPRFSGGAFVVPTNQHAKNLVAACIRGLPGPVPSNDIQAMISTAVHASELFAASGRGEAGWKALSETLKVRPVARASRPR